MIYVQEILEQQCQEIAKWHLGETFEVLSPWLNLVSEQNRKNYDLWHQEDLARDPDSDDAVIASVKRKIDQLNQQRNDLIEQVDEWLVGQLYTSQSSDEEAPMNSETPGSIIDRLSINALKIYHMNEEALRENASVEHRSKCTAKLRVLEEQRRDLAKCLLELEQELLDGTKRIKVYRQMKMYNDPALNPVLYRKK
jgi:cell division protein FtsB